MVAPESAMQDAEIFMRLLDAAGEKMSYSSPSEIFAALAKEIPGYRDLGYAAIGDLGTTLGGGEATQQ